MGLPGRPPAGAAPPMQQPPLAALPPASASPPYEPPPLPVGRDLALPVGPVVTDAGRSSTVSGAKGDAVMNSGPQTSAPQQQQQQQQSPQLVHQSRQGQYQQTAPHHAVSASAQLPPQLRPPLPPPPPQQQQSQGGAAPGWWAGFANTATAWMPGGPFPVLIQRFIKTRKGKATLLSKQGSFEA